MIVDGFVMVMTISSISYWFHIVTTMLIINLVTIFSKAIYAMLKLEDVRGLFSHEFFFSSIVLLPMASWTISQVFPLHSQVRTQWRLLAKALMTPRSKSMNPIQKSPKSQSEIFGSWGSSYQYQYIYIYAAAPPPPVAWNQAPGLPWTMPSSASWPASHGCPAQQFSGGPWKAMGCEKRDF